MSTVTQQPQPTQDPKPTYGELRTEEEKKIDAAVLARVKLGLALLEREHGPEWVEHIDLGELQLEHSEHCVLGQLYKHYDTGVKDLFGSLSERSQQLAFGYGFLHESDLDGNVWFGDTDTRAERYAELQEAWEHVLTPRIARG